MSSFPSKLNKHHLHLHLPTIFPLILHMHKNERERDDLTTSRGIENGWTLCLLQEGERIKGLDQRFCPPRGRGREIQWSPSRIYTLRERESKVLMGTFKLHQFMKEMRDSNMEKRELSTKIVCNPRVISIEIRLCSMYLIYFWNTKKDMSINSQAHLLTKTCFLERELVESDLSYERE